MLFEKRANVFRTVEIGRRQLVCKQIPLARVSVDEDVAECYFTFSLEVAVRGVEVVEAPGEEFIHHLGEFCEVDLAVLHR